MKSSFKSNPENNQTDVTPHSLIPWTKSPFIEDPGKTDFPSKAKLDTDYGGAISTLPNGQRLRSRGFP